MSTIVSGTHTCHKCADVRRTEDTLIEISKDCHDTVQFPSLDTTQTSFRLVRLMPSRHEGSIISCLLFPATQAVWKGRYVAGSYVCGPPEPKEFIYVNGSPFSIGINLHSFLVACRKYSETRGLCTGLFIWIDAICIDQNSFRERNHQVGIMKQIFQNASATFSWLGPSADDSDWLFDVFNLSDRLKEPADTMFQQPYLVDPNDPVTCEEHPSARLYSEIVMLSQRDYFTRLWILQEFVLAPKVLLMCGDKTLKLHVLTKWLDAVDLTSTTFQSSLTKRMQSTIFAKMLTMRRTHFFTSNFEDIFEEFGCLKCSLGHDKIYALRSLMPFTDTLSDKLKLQYEQPMHIVLGDILASGQLTDPFRFTKTALRELGVDALSSDLMHFSRPGHSFESRPVWVALLVREDSRDLRSLCVGLSGSGRLKVVRGAVTAPPDEVRVVKITAGESFTQHLVLGSFESQKFAVVWGALMRRSSCLLLASPALVQAYQSIMYALWHHGILQWHHDHLSLRLRIPYDIFTAWAYICDLIDSHATIEGNVRPIRPEIGARLAAWSKKMTKELNVSVSSEQTLQFLKKDQEDLIAWLLSPGLRTREFNAYKITEREGFERDAELARTERDVFLGAERDL